MYSVRLTAQQNPWQLVRVGQAWIRKKPGQAKQRPCPYWQCSAGVGSEGPTELGLFVKAALLVTDLLSPKSPLAIKLQ